MNALSMEGAPHGILVSAISPVAKTRMWGITRAPEGLKPEWVAPVYPTNLAWVECASVQDIARHWQLVKEFGDA